MQLMGRHVDNDDVDDDTIETVVVVNDAVMSYPL